jgi:alpha/beta superfamily hydrolase
MGGRSSRACSAWPDGASLDGRRVVIELQGPVGRLEALWEQPASPAFAALVCHPHPLFGGTMNNHATYRLARAVRAQGGATLRFNFRGVGLSAGRHDAGRGEADDARAGLAFLAEHHPGLPRYACGFSFGAWMALAAGCGDPAVRGVLCAGLALSLREVATEQARGCPKPLAVVQAERDEFGRPEEVAARLSGATAPRRLAAVPGCTHLFTEDLGAFEREAGAALTWLREAAP